MVRAFTYSQYHGKYEPVGSDYLRIHQMIPHWKDFDLYKYGENPDAIIFTKVFVSQDYRFPEHWKGIKILDICDPMHFENFNLVETAQLCQAVTVPTQGLRDLISQFHKKVIIIPDRFDLAKLPKPKAHHRQAKTVVWFGYSHNSELLKTAMPLIDELELNLNVISNDDRFLHLWGNRKRETFYKFTKYDEKTIYDELQTADFAILPDGNRPEDAFKSNNKTIKAQLAGLPVAKTPDEVRKFIDPKARQQWIDNNYAKIQTNYDIRKSVLQYQSLIKELSHEN